MKRLFVGLALSAMLLWSSHAGEIKLAEGGKPLATIVTPPKSGIKIVNAAKDLQAYVVKICGVKLPIRTDGKRVNGTGLYIGECEGSPQCTLEKSGKSWEGYVIDEKEGNLYFLGLNPTPVAFGVYSFIEDDLGVRWFAPGELWEKVPKAAKPGALTVNVRPRTVIPETSPRIWSAHNWAPIWDEWDIRNKTNLSEVISRRNFQNKIYQIFPVEKYGKSHPEYYPLMTNGKRYIPIAGDKHWRPCESNPEVQRIVVEYINDYFDKNPLQDSFSVGMDDITHLCSCPNCRAMDDAPDSYEHKRFSDRHYKFVNIIAKEVAKTHPDKYIGTLIYQIALQPPKTVPVMEPNVFGYITETSAAWWMPGQKEIDHELTTEWSKRVKNLFRYDYYGFASMTPRYYPHYVDEQMKYDKAKGMVGMYIETYTFLPLTMPMIWLFAKLEWDSSLNADQMLDEFMGIYGAAKPQMARFWDLLEKSYQTDRPGRGKWEHRRIENQAMASSPEDLDKAFAILDEALQVADSDEVKARIAIHRDALKLSAYAIKPYAYNLQIQNTEVKTQADADKVFDLAVKLEESKAGRDEYVKELFKRDDMIGLNIRGLQKHKEYMQLSAFGKLESSGMLGLLQAINWYAMNKPEALQARVNKIQNAYLKELANEYMKQLSSGQPPKNLIFNGDFEIREEEKTVSKDMEGWEAEGCPKGWNSWSRSDKLHIKIVPEGRSGNAVKLSHCIGGGSLIQAVKAEPGGVYMLSCYMKLVGNGKASLGIRFRTNTGHWCKSRQGENSSVFAPEKEGEWTRVMLMVTVPTEEARQISVMATVENLEKDSYILMDDFMLYKIK